MLAATVPPDEAQSLRRHPVDLAELTALHQAWAALARMVGPEFVQVAWLGRGAVEGGQVAWTPAGPLDEDEGRRLAEAFTPRLVALTPGRRRRVRHPRPRLGQGGIPHRIGAAPDRRRREPGLRRAPGAACRGGLETQRAAVRPVPAAPPRSRLDQGRAGPLCLRQCRRRGRLRRRARSSHGRTDDEVFPPETARHLVKSVDSDAIAELLAEGGPVD